jgi:putative hydroxymethylpyrimidine transport system substrate-binding protein
MRSTARIDKPGRRLRQIAALALAGSAVAGLAACGGSSSGSSSASPASGSSAPLTTVKFVFDWIPTTGDVPVLAAQKFGWFTDGGIKVVTTPGGPSVSGSTLVSAGQQDIGIVPPTGVMSARANGAPLISVGLTQPTGPTGLICNPDAGISASDPKTLDGKKIGFSNNANDAIQTKWMQENGVDVKSVKKVQSGADLSLMIAKQVDCQPNFLTLVPLQVKEHYGKDAVIFKTSSIGAVGQSIVTNESYLASHQKEVQAFLTGYAKGMQWALANVDDAVKLVKASYPSYDEKQAALELPLLQKFWVNSVDQSKGLLYFDQATLQPTYDVVKGTQWLTKDIDLSKAFSTAALPSPAIMP